MDGETEVREVEPLAKIPGTNAGLTALDAAVCSLNTGTLPL